MNILILGGSRFLGRRLALLLHEQGQTGARGPEGHTHGYGANYIPP